MHLLSSVRICILFFAILTTIYFFFFIGKKKDLIEFLLNSDEGAKLMKSERGIPLSKKANELCAQEGLLNAKVAEANAKVLDWCSNKLDPKFESSALKSSDGVDSPTRITPLRKPLRRSATASPKCWPSNFQIDNRSGLADVKPL